MSSTTYHTQCTLQKKDGSTQTSWIPSKFANQDKYVQLKKDDGTWDDGWKVIQVGTKMLSKFIQERTQDYKNMRKMTDI